MRTVIVTADRELSLRGCTLVMTNRAGGSVETCPVEEMGMLLVESAASSFTPSVVNALTAAGAAVILCDDAHMPASMVLPYGGGRVRDAVMRSQLVLPDTDRDALWGMVVKGRTENRRGALACCGAYVPPAGHAPGEGDPEGEEEAAYFRSMFGDGFVRDRNAGDANALLNYGYSIVRGMVARSVAVSGLFSGSGIRPHPEKDAFPLVSDLMEPFRPFVDVAVRRLVEEGRVKPDRGCREELADTIYGAALVGGCRHLVIDACGVYVSSVAQFVCGKRGDILLPCIERG